MTENELNEFYMHMETKNADLRSLVGELVEALEEMVAECGADPFNPMRYYDPRVGYCEAQIGEQAYADAVNVIAKAKEQVK